MRLCEDYSCTEQNRIVHAARTSLGSILRTYFNGVRQILYEKPFFVVDKIQSLGCRVKSKEFDSKLSLLIPEINILRLTVSYTSNF